MVVLCSSLVFGAPIIDIGGGGDPCDSITCESYCSGTTLMDAYCSGGICVDVANDPSCIDYVNNKNSEVKLTDLKVYLMDEDDYKREDGIYTVFRASSDTVSQTYITRAGTCYNDERSQTFRDVCSANCQSVSECYIIGAGSGKTDISTFTAALTCGGSNVCVETNIGGKCQTPLTNNVACTKDCECTSKDCLRKIVRTKPEPVITYYYPDEQTIPSDWTYTETRVCSCLGEGMRCDNSGKCCEEYGAGHSAACFDYNSDGIKTCGASSCSGENEPASWSSDGCCFGLTACGDGICRTICSSLCTPGDSQSRSCGSDVGACVSGTQSRTCSASSIWSAWSVCVGQVSPVAEVCNNGLDDDCDSLTDGFDTNCPEGSGNNSNSTERGCWDDINNNLINNQTDEDDNGCCDVCTSNGFVFDNKYSQNNALGTSCGNISMNWENISIQSPYCCGDDANEHYITTGIGYEKGLRACCDKATDCIDNNGLCQNNVAEILGNGVDDDCDGTTDSLSENTYEKCINGLDDDADGLTDYPDDNDCIGSLSGTIYEDKNPGMIVESATVRGMPALESKYQSKSTLSDYQGRYNISKALVGTYTFIASKKYYIDDIRTITIISGKTTTKDFNMKKGMNCHVDCTDSNNICNPSCQGFNQSGETCNLIKDCEYRPKEYLAMVSNGTITTQTLCCEGPSTTYPTLKPTVTGDIDTLYDYTFPAKINGVTPVKVHILYWESN